MMKWLSLFRRKTVDRNLIDRYRQLRRVARQLNVTLIKQLPRPAVPECGKKLGVVKAGTLVLRDDEELAVIYDYCLHHYRRGNKNVIERFLAQSPPDPGSDERKLLDAMTGSWASAFRIIELKPHQGALMLDLATGEQIDLTDLTLAEAGLPGTIVVGRILRFPELTMSSGTLIPLPEAAFEQSVTPLIGKFLPEGGDGARGSLSPAQTAAFVALLIRIALHAGGEDAVFYTDMEPGD